MKKIKAAFFISVLALPLLFFFSLYLPFPRQELSPAPVVSLSLVDRNGVLLREVLSDEGGRCQWVSIQDVSLYLLKATVFAEDRHFFLHSGINPASLARAIYQNLKYGRIVSGASTITQQLVRNLKHKPRNLLSKAYEAWLALRLDRTLAKEEILLQYLNRICYGNQAYGIAAASRLYFDKPARDLSLAEAAFLAGLPRSPSALNPYRSLPQARKRQKDILSLMLNYGAVSGEEWERASHEPLRVLSEKEKFRAPHFCDYILSQVPAEQRRRLSVIITTLDYSLQGKVEILVKNHLKSLEKKAITNAAVVVMENAGGEILSLVGSQDFFDERHDGQVNGALSLRQPGSTLKPFTYGLALEKGMTAAEILEDIDLQFPTPEGSYRPRNYDKRFHGPVRLRQALACSYNVPAVSVLQGLGPDLLYQRLKLLGFRSLKKSPSHYGLGLTLGNGEVTLLELVRAYAVLARGGVFLQEKTILKLCDLQNESFERNNKSEGRQAFSPEISYVLTHILSDRDARIPAFGYYSPLNLPFDCAAKTGTTMDFKDNWTVGFTPRFTVGVWVGNFDGQPMQNISGVTGCGPLFRSIMLLLEGDRPKPRFRESPGLKRVRICPTSGKLATDACPGSMEDVFIQGTEPQEFCAIHPKKNSQPGNLRDRVSPSLKRGGFKILFPSDGDIFKLDPVLRKEYQTVKFKASLPEGWEIEAVEWLVNGKKAGESAAPFSLFWVLRPGFYTIESLAKAGHNRWKARPVRIQVLS